MAVCLATALAHAASVEEAWGLLESGELEAADEAARRALSENFENPDALCVAGAVLAKQGRFARAEELLELALERDWQTSDLAYAFGLLAFERADRQSAKGKPKKARRLYEKAAEQYELQLAVDADHVGALEGRAWALFEAGRRDAAIRASRAWVGREPDRDEAKQLLAQLLARKGLVDEAERILGRPIGRRPADESTDRSPSPAPQTPPESTARQGLERASPEAPSVPSRPDEARRSEAVAPKVTVVGRPTEAEPVQAPIEEPVGLEPAPAPGTPPPDDDERIPTQRPPQRRPAALTESTTYAMARRLYEEGRPEQARELFPKLESAAAWRRHGLDSLDALARGRPVQASSALLAFVEAGPPGEEVEELARIYHRGYRDAVRSGWKNASPRDRLPEAQLRVVPHYPVRARTRGIGGTVRSLAVIGENGDVLDVIVFDVRLSAYEKVYAKFFARAAAEAIRQWSFRPGMRGGAPARFPVTVTLTFDAPR